MPKQTRLTGTEIRKLAPEKRLNSSLFSLSITKTPGHTAKIACVVSKKVSARAVVRNMIKRRMRSALRVITPLPHGCSLMLTAKKSVVTVPYAEVRDDIAALIARVA